ncbi:MAG TPA: SRPBCC domain-containing protein, partial [Ktedonobacterales bacterium]|nr:SRPBCC domain-containing protein [Ktedonobacterales bacterium]
RFVYRDIQPPERMVFVNSFSDEEGNVTRAPFNPTWPLEVLNTLTLSEADGKTTLTLRGGPINATEEERETFWKAQESLRQGFAGTFDKLSDYLSGDLKGR